MRVPTLLLMILGSAGLGSAQPPPGSGRARPTAAGLTSEEARKVQRQLKDYGTGLRLRAARPEALRQAGLSPANDALEAVVSTPTRTVGPVHVGLLRPASSGPLTSDPGLTAANRSMLRARLGREPSPAELDAERRRFDERIAQVNRALVQARPQISRALRRDGTFPGELESRILGVRPPDPQAGSAEARQGIRALLQMMLTR